MYVFKMYFDLSFLTKIIIGPVLPTHFQGKLLKEGQFVAKLGCDVIAQ